MAGYTHSPSHDRAALADLKWHGQGLVRPECVLLTAKGDMYTADWRGGVAHTESNGRQQLIQAHAIDGELLRPNGIALRSDGSFLIAHLGEQHGGVFRLQRNGETTLFLREVEGLALPPTNFVTEDVFGRVWITVSTRQKPRALGYRKTCNDGFIILVDRAGARIVADGLGYTNECLLDRSEKWLYVNETFARRLSRFAVRSDGSLGEKQVVTEFGAGIFPDGLALDEAGGIWVVSIVSNSVLRVLPDGTTQRWLEDADSDYVAWVEQAYQSDTMGRAHLDRPQTTTLRGISSLAFGGPDLRTGYLGCLAGNAVATLPMPYRGVPPIHWHF